MGAEIADFTTIVSGVPRSGTSVMMQMLVAGGMSVLTDGVRAADADNPRGYWEVEAVKGLRRDASWMEGARGKAVKVVHVLLAQLPVDRAYRVVFMRRDLDEVLASQRAMLARQGRQGAAVNDAALKTIYAEQVSKAIQWMERRAGSFHVMEVEYATLVADPIATARAVNAFLGGTLNEAAMAGTVEAGLYRNRK